MKKTSIMFMGGILLFALMGCGSTDSGSKESKGSETSSTTKKEEKTETTGDFVSSAADSTFDGTTLKGNSYTIKITSNKVIQPGEPGNEYGEKPVLAFWFDTLVSPDYKDEAEINPNMAWIMSFKAVQDNDPNKVNKLNVSSLPDAQFLESQMAEIKPGGTVASAMGYELTDTETPVTLIAQDILGTEYGKADFPVN
ncbi:MULTISPECIES: DUF5067 domain-containing protein [unclassified Enterococcus]|uniref:DUF5067 domain-containing protein n=1 Tax=unclassified Enterococcus TaxID=2608891 RepID=UPI001CE06A84|nr:MULTISPECIES: DUF5067 domain-containing protein [unclassified Enterococcus]MCA5012715.1 DUF5067 domain-containing protein [Enterococcus sp. S23]MCA5015966.1 DUF5067 domain-containing protein [Enterococcus sp. S22(2020)]